MKVKFRLFLLCLCSAVALVECEKSDVEKKQDFFDAIIQHHGLNDDVKTLTFEQIYHQSRKEMKEEDPKMADRANAEFDKMDTNQDGKINRDELMTFLQSTTERTLAE